jgi:DnaD/phage-associated family protein
VPTQWLRDVLAETESLAELKVTLHVLRLLDAKRAYPRYARVSELRADAVTMASLQMAGGISPDDALAEGVRLAVARGVLVAVSVDVAQQQEPAEGAEPGDGAAGAEPARPARRVAERGEPGTFHPPERDDCLFLNTPANRELVARVLRREVRLELGRPAPPAVLPARRPTIYELYEQNVGLLTPLLVEELREAADTYPAEWIEAAFREAVAYNRRHWRYVQRILEKWATQGRAESGAAGGRPQAPRDPRRYIEGKYGHLIQH